jgi:molybdopterin molybdotransferase
MPGSLISVDDARARVLASARVLPAEDVRASDALGRVLAEDVVSDLELPPFDSSAMDGYAIAGGGPELVVVGESRAGLPFEGRLQVGDAVRISTGAVLPEGADAVVPIERVEELDGRIRVPQPKPGAHIRRAGEDVHRGEVVLRSGNELGAAELGMLAALGRTEAACVRRPRLLLGATGDELRLPGQQLEPGQIYNSNAAAISALAERAGGEVIGAPLWIDDSEHGTVEGLGALAISAAEVLCITGGVSVGPHDHVKGALAELGFEQQVWGVALKPGKPFYFGVRDDAHGRRYALGLPGNPVSAMVTFILFGRPLLRALQGADPAALRSTAVLDGPIAANSDRDQAVRCRLRMADDGWHAEPTGAQGSHVMSSMVGAGALAPVPAGERDIGPGERVSIELL